jgi:deaminated glutathione amidase
VEFFGDHVLRRDRVRLDGASTALPRMLDRRQSEWREEIVTASMGAVEVGLSVCYDLRFPELYRILAVRGARLITVPSAFTLATGRDHWEVLVRARAIENQAFLIAPDQVGEAPPHYSSYGRSMIVDPWGEVLCDLGQAPGIAIATISPHLSKITRQRIPVLQHERATGVRQSPGPARIVHDPL